MYDFSNAPAQRSDELIPDGTIATVHISLKPGNTGEGGWLTRSTSGEYDMLNLELTVVDGPYAKRKFWHSLCVGAGGTIDLKNLEGKQLTTCGIAQTKVRAILESARGVRPDDNSEEARAKLRMKSWGELDNLRFMTTIDVEPRKGAYAGKGSNRIGFVITPEKKTWAKAEQIFQQAPPIAAQAAATASNASKPAWAQ